MTFGVITSIDISCTDIIQENPFLVKGFGYEGYRSLEHTCKAIMPKVCRKLVWLIMSKYQEHRGVFKIKEVNKTASRIEICPLSMCLVSLL